MQIVAQFSWLFEFSKRLRTLERRSIEIGVHSAPPQRADLFPTASTLLRGSYVPCSLLNGAMVVQQG